MTHIRCPTCGAITGILTELGVNQETAKWAGEEIGKRVEKKVKRKLNKWTRFLKKFTFRKKKKREDSKKYLATRTRAAARKWKVEKRKKG